MSQPTTPRRPSSLWLLAAPKFSRGAQYATLATLAARVSADPAHPLHAHQGALPNSKPTEALITKRLRLEIKKEMGIETTPIKGSKALRLHIPAQDTTTLTERTATLEPHPLVWLDCTALTTDEKTAIEAIHLRALSEALPDELYTAHTALVRALHPLEIGAAYLYPPLTATTARQWYKEIKEACPRAQTAVALVDPTDSPELARDAAEALKDHVTALIEEAKTRAAASTNTRAGTLTERLSALSEAQKLSEELGALVGSLKGELDALITEGKSAWTALQPEVQDLREKVQRRTTPAPAPAPEQVHATAPAPEQEQVHAPAPAPEQVHATAPAQEQEQEQTHATAPTQEPIQAAAESAGAIPPNAVLLWTDRAGQLVVIHALYGALHATWTEQGWIAQPIDPAQLLPPLDHARADAHAHQGVLPPCASAFTLVSAGEASWIDNPTGHPYARVN
jgi:hypothetical protein